jgi:hypothetical protein
LISASERRSRRRPCRAPAESARACATEASGTPILRATSSASASAGPAHRIDDDLVDLLRRVAATSSMSMPPSLEAISTARCEPRSTTMPTYSSFGCRRPPRPAGGALSALRGRSGGSSAACPGSPRVARNSSRDARAFTPPPLPRPPAWICALTTQTCRRVLRRRPTASSTLKHGMPRGVGTPNLRRISFA